MKGKVMKLLQTVVLFLMVSSIVASIGQLTVSAQDPLQSPCVGLPCWDGSDCGTKCFCNRPTGTCVADTILD
jgi:hypothetical protein